MEDVLQKLEKLLVQLNEELENNEKQMKFYTDEELFDSAYQKENDYFLDKNNNYINRQALFDIIEEVLRKNNNEFIND